MSRSAALSFALLALTTGSVAGQEMDNMIFHFTQLEVDAARVDGDALARWEGAGWIGTDFDRLWWSTEGENEGGTLGHVGASTGQGYERAPHRLSQGGHVRERVERRGIEHGDRRCCGCGHGTEMSLRYSVDRLVDPR